MVLTFIGRVESTTKNKTDLKIDYEKSIDMIAVNRELIRAIYYCSKPISPSGG